MEIESKLGEIFDDVLLHGKELEPEKTREEYEKWDSLVNVTLLMAINEEFSNVISLDDMAELDSFAKIQDFLKSKLS